MDRLKNIVVGVDFSRSSENALAQAMRIAHWNAAKLHVVHVIEPLIATSLADAYGVPDVDTWDGFGSVARERTAAMISAARDLNAQTAQTGPVHVEIDVEILFGNPFVHLLREVRDVSAGLLVLGSHGSSDSSQGPGGLAIKCMRKAPTNVMLLREVRSEPFKRIVACVGLSDICRLVVEQAIRIARQDKSSLRVLHLYRLPGEAVHDGAPTPGASPESQQQFENRLDGHLRELLPPFGSEMSGLKVEIHPADTPDEKDGVIEFVRSSAADLVVLGTRGRPELKGTPSPTTAERIVRETPCSVLAIKPEDFKYDVGGASRRR